MDLTLLLLCTHYSSRDSEDDDKTKGTFLRQ